MVESFHCPGDIVHALMDCDQLPWDQYISANDSFVKVKYVKYVEISIKSGVNAKFVLGLPRKQGLEHCTKVLRGFVH